MLTSTLATAVMEAAEVMEAKRGKRRAADQSIGGNDQEGEEGEALEQGQRGWSILPEIPLESILTRLRTLEDFFSFRGVCRSWRSAAIPTRHSTPSQSPLILLARFPGRTEAFYDIAHDRLYAASLPWRRDSRYTLGYSHGHLITSTYLSPWKPLLWNIFTGATIRLPHTRKKFSRAILSSLPSSPDCVVVLFDYDMEGFQYCRIGDRWWLEFSWDQLGQSFTSDYQVEDLIFVHGRLYSVSLNAVLGVVDLFPHPNVTKLELKHNQLEAFECSQWLAELDGQLLLVCPILNRINVCRWDFSRGELVEVSDLGGRALFMGHEGFAGSVVADGLDVKPNCIYCIGALENKWFILSLDDKSVEFVSPDSCGLLRGHIGKPPVWVIPSLC